MPSCHGILGLDVGGVLLLSPWELLLQVVPDPQRIGPFCGPLSDGADKAYETMLSGRITESQYWEYFSSGVRSCVDALRTADNPVSHLIRNNDQVIRPAMLAWAREFVLSGGALVTLSNGLYRNLGRDWWSQAIPPGLVERHIDALDTGVRKPDVRAFHELLALSKARQTRSVIYVDDNPHYVNAANAAGLAGLWFRITDEHACLTQLSRFYKIERSDRGE
jgi:hypothetical protein